MRTTIVILTAALLTWMAGCGLAPLFPGVGGTVEGAAIVGRLVPADNNAKGILLAQQAGGCPDLVVRLNSAQVTIELDDECGFLISDVGPTGLLELRVELPGLGVSGTIEISQVIDGELIEIDVLVSDSSLSLIVARRVSPAPSSGLPTEVRGNNTSLMIGAGVHDQSLSVFGNNFTLVGRAGVACGGAGWSRITGDVLVSGNNATFRNIAFEGDVEIRGNNPRFINCCFDGELLVFGNNLRVE